MANVGERFGRFELRRLIGRGGMGEVYEAFDTDKERTVALKLLPATMADDPEFTARFRREARTAARIENEHIVPIYDYGEIDGRLYIEMRLVRGRDLRSLLDSEGRLSPERAVNIIEQVGEALDAAHADGLVHRDVKPENVLVTDRDFAYLADFGIARAGAERGVTRTGMTVGTFAYMAPERFNAAGQIGPAADIYALGCLMSEFLTGSKPFGPEGDVVSLVAAHASGPRPRPSALVTSLPPCLDQVVARATAIDPATRFDTAGAVGAAARACLATGQIPVALADRPTVSQPVPAVASALTQEAPVRSETPVAVAAPSGGSGEVAGRPSGSRGRGPWPWVAGGLAVLLLAFGAFIALNRGGSTTKANTSTSSQAASSTEPSASSSTPGPNSSTSGVTASSPSAPGVTATSPPAAAATAVKLSAIPNGVRNWADCSAFAADDREDVYTYAENTTPCTFARSVLRGWQANGRGDGVFQVRRTVSDSNGPTTSVTCTGSLPVYCESELGTEVFLVPKGSQISLTPSGAMATPAS